MAVDKKTIIELLGSGVEPKMVASAVGCEVSYISQLMADDDFRSQVVEKRSIALQANTKRDRFIDNLEDRVLQKLSDSLDLMYKPSDLLRAFAVINRAERRGAQVQETSNITNNIVTLNLPVAVTNQVIVTNEHSEVIEIDGQTMVSMPAHSLLKSLQNSQHGDTYAKVSNFLPNGDNGGYVKSSHFHNNSRAVKTIVDRARQTEAETNNL